MKEITHRIDPQEIAFHVITLQFDKSAPRQEQIDNVTVHRVGVGGVYLSKILFIPLAALKARSLHKQLQFDGMWAMMTYMTMPLMLAKYLGVRIPHVLTLQDGDPYDKVFERWFIRPLTPLIDAGFKQAKVIQVISEYLGTWPKKRGYQGEVVLVRNGANPKNFTQYYSDEELEKVKQELGKQTDDFYLFIAARMVYQKAMDVIIRSLTLLPPNVKFLIAGAGPDEQMLRDLTKELQVEDRVVFLGALDRDDVPKYRNTIVTDAFVHPSRSEGLGNSVLSAMAGRVPVIATRVGGFQDFVFDPVHTPEQPPTAWVVEPDSAEQIAEAVRDIMNNPQAVAERTQHARTLMETEYHWDAVSKRMQTEVFASLWR